MARKKRGARSDWLELDRRAFLAVLAVVVVVAMVAALYLLLVSRTAGQGRRIQRLQNQLMGVERENAQLEVNVARASSVHRLIDRAIELGLIFPLPDHVRFVRRPSE